MGVATSPVLALGKEFTSESEAADFLREHGFLIDSDDDFEEQIPSGLILQNLDLYSCDYYYLGINLRGGTVIDFRESLDRATSSWHEKFPDVQPDVIYTVRYH